MDYSGIEIPLIHRSQAVTAAMEEIAGSYTYPPRDFTVEAYRQFCETGAASKKHALKTLATYIGEALLWHPFLWLREERGWKGLRYASEESPIIRRNGKVTTKSTGMRVKVSSKAGDAELDCLVRIDGQWLIGEAKSGTNSFSMEDPGRKITRLQCVIRQPASFVLGVPRGHDVLDPAYGKAEYLESRGGYIHVFHADPQSIRSFASDLLSGNF